MCRRAIAITVLGVLSTIATVVGLILPVVTLSEAQGSGSGGVFTYSELDVKITMWQLCARAVGGVRCSAPATCTSSESVYDQCDTIDEGCLIHFFRAIRAFAILASATALFGTVGGGIADILGKLPMPRFVLAGLSGALFFFELLAFCMFLGIWTTACNGADSLSETDNTSWGAMPIVYCLAMVLAVVMIIVALLSADAADAEAEDNEGAKATDAAACNDRAAASNGGTGGTTAETPCDGPGVEGDWRWVAAWRLWWSATEQLYLDHETGWYLDAPSQQWYNPETGEWTIVVMERALPKGPPADEAKTAAEVPPQHPEAEAHEDAGDADAHLATDPGDFAYDEGSGLYWSDSHGVYKDPETEMRYCPNTERWYDPQARRWVHS